MEKTLQLEHLPPFGSNHIERLSFSPTVVVEMRYVIICCVKFVRDISLSLRRYSITTKSDIAIAILYFTALNFTFGV